MSNLNLSKFMKDIGAAVSKRSPEILTGIGIAGMISTTVLAVKATPKAVRILEEEKRNRELDRKHGVDNLFAPEKISVTDTVKLCWKCYIPSAVTCATSITCLIGASSVNAKRNAALTAAYKLSESALHRYKNAVIETIGEKKEHAVQDKVAESHIKENPVVSSEVIITEKGNTLCYDTLSGRYFKSDIEKIKKAENIINHRMLDDMYVSLNEFYDEIDLPHTKVGDELGWNINISRMIELYFSSQIAEDGTPCIVINYDTTPECNYNKLL